MTNSWKLSEFQGPVTSSILYLFLFYFNDKMSDYFLEDQFISTLAKFPWHYFHAAIEKRDIPQVISILNIYVQDDQRMLKFGIIASGGTQKVLSRP